MSETQTNTFARVMQRLGFCQDVDYFDARVSLPDMAIIPVAPDDRLAVSEQHFAIHAPLDTVFEAYQSADPQDMWPRDRITFQFCTMPGSDKRYVPGDELPPMQVGLKMFCNLKVKPFDRHLAIMVPVQVTRIETNREIRYDYLQNSVTRGFNSMRFHQETDENGEPITYIHHYSEYEAMSRRLKLVFPIMQPILHVGFVNALHHGMKHRIESKLKS